jgi:hypothetical protein
LIVIQQDENHLKLEQRKLALANNKRLERWNSLKQWANLVNSWSWMVILLALVFALGLHTGINLIAKGIICQSRETLCYFLRFDGNKTTIQ